MTHTGLDIRPAHLKDPHEDIAPESEYNLTWLEAGRHYRCLRSLFIPEQDSGLGDQKRQLSLEEDKIYKFESFSSDPLGDTRQYLFYDVEMADYHAAELTADMPTPVWKSYLVLAD